MEKMFNTKQIEDILVGIKSYIDDGTIITLTHQKVDNVHQLSGLNGATGIIPATFIATADFASGDILIIDGESYTIQMNDGTPPSDNMFVSVDTVVIIVDTTEKIVTFKHIVDDGNGYIKDDMIAAENLEKVLEFTGKDYDWLTDQLWILEQYLSCNPQNTTSSAHSYSVPKMDNGWLGAAKVGVFNEFGVKEFDLPTNTLPSPYATVQPDSAGNWYTFFCNGANIEVVKVSDNGTEIWRVRHTIPSGYEHILGGYISQKTDKAIWVRSVSANNGYSMIYNTIDLETGSFSEDKSFGDGFSLYLYSFSYDYQKDVLYIVSIDTIYTLSFDGSLISAIAMEPKLPPSDAGVYNGYLYGRTYLNYGDDIGYGMISATTGKLISKTSFDVGNGHFHVTNGQRSVAIELTSSSSFRCFVINNNGLSYQSDYMRYQDSTSDCATYPIGLDGSKGFFLFNSNYLYIYKSANIKTTVYKVLEVSK